MYHIIRFLAAAAPGRLALRLTSRYSRHGVAHRGAALAYYLLFSLFPLLLLAGSLLGTLRVETAGIMAALKPLLPEEVRAIAGEYLRFVSENVSAPMLGFSLIFSLYFPLRSTGCLMGGVRLAYGLGFPKSKFWAACKALLYTSALMGSLMLTLALSTLGTAAAEILPLPAGAVKLWGVGRFFLLGGVIFAALSVLYALSQDRPRSPVLPGAALATLFWIPLSALYSFYTQFISDQSLIYGALSTVTVLMIWLYLTALTVILGAEANAAIARDRRSRRPIYHKGDF